LASSERARPPWWDGATVVAQAADWLMDNRDWRRFDWDQYDFETLPAPPDPL
jgi:hypothetical protein